jgi:hypothetical protein
MTTLSEMFSKNRFVENSVSPSVMCGMGSDGNVEPMTITSSGAIPATPCGVGFSKSGDEILVSRTSLDDVYSLYLNSVLIETITITYLTTEKEDISRVKRT